MKFAFGCFLLGVSLLMPVGAATAQTPAAQSKLGNLTIALAGSVSSLDPHFHNFGPNNTVAEHIFEKLTRFDADGALVSGLATEWSMIEPNVWVFSLRQSVTFHDGLPFTADDVVFSFTRATQVPNSPGPFTAYLKGIDKVEAIDAHRVRLTLKAPNALLPFDLSTIFIVSRKAGEGATTDDYNSGKATVGTGPFRFASYERGERVMLARHDGYWDTRPTWAAVTLRIIPKAPSRVASLLAGDVDVIEAVSTKDAAGLAKDPAVTVAARPSTRLIYVALDQERDDSPFVDDGAGNRLAKNPLKDERVRRALALAIDRDAIRDRIMGGFAVPAAQLVPEGTAGHVAGLTPVYDLSAARALLADAGYPNGFGMTLHGSNDRYANDGEILQAVAAMWTKAGIKTKVEVMPFATMATQVRSRAVSAYQVGFAAVTGHGAAQLRTLVMSYDAKQGQGVLNYGRFSDAAIDADVDAAFQAADPAARAAAVERATKAAKAREVLIPIHFQVTVTAARAELAVRARSDEYTLAQDLSPK